MVKKSDVSDWIDAGLKANIDGFKDKNPNLTVTLETIPGWTAEYIPKILSMVSAGQIGDAVWYPPRHRSAIAWGVRYNVVRDLNPLAKAVNYDMGQFFKGAIDANTWDGKTYWMDYIGEPVTPLIAYNKTAVTKMGVGEPKDDWTWDDLTTWAKSLTKDGTFGYYRADAGDDSFGSAPYYRQWGVEFVDSTGKKATLLDNRDAFVAALKYRYDLVNTWKVSPSPAAGTVNVTELIGSQKLIAGDVWPFRIQGYPDAFKDFEWGFVLKPTVKAGEKKRSMLNEHVFGVTTASNGVQWCSVSVGGSSTRYQVFRTTTGNCNATDATFQVDYITSFGSITGGNYWSLPACSTGRLQAVSVNLPVNQYPVTKPNETYDLADTIAMRNAPACP